MAAASAVAATANAVQPIVVNLITPSRASALQWVQVVGTIVVAVIAAGIAATIQWRQMKIARQKVKLDLFDRRSIALDAVFELTRKVKAGRFDAEAIADYHAQTSAVRWLFNDDVDRVFTRVAELAIDWQATRARKVTGETDSDYASRCAQQESAFKAFSEDLARIDEIVGPFMEIEH